MFTDKVTRAKFSPSLVQFGGRAVEGWVAITSTGLVSGFTAYMRSVQMLPHHSIVVVILSLTTRPFV